jgi:SPP1 family predicted phage head-tail adaptor
MRAGSLDRRVTIQRKTVTQSSSGDPVETWDDVATVWAQVLPDRGGERFARRQLVGSAVVLFRMRYLSGVTVLDRLSYGDKLWDIVDVRETGRREGLDIDATARADD